MLNLRHLCILFFLIGVVVLSVVNNNGCGLSCNKVSNCNKAQQMNQTGGCVCGICCIFMLPRKLKYLVMAHPLAKIGNDLLCQ